MRYLSDFFWRRSWDVATLFPNNSEFHVCLSVCLCAYFLTKLDKGISPDLDVISCWNFLKIFLELLYLATNYSEFHVCLSVCFLLTSLPKLENWISPLLDEIFSWNFLETFLRCWYTGCKWYWFFYVCQSGRWHA